MRKIINLILIVINICLLARTQVDDIVDISQIPVFPQGYSATIRAGYLSITQNTQSFYYILCERYFVCNAASRILIPIPLFYG